MPAIRTNRVISKSLEWRTDSDGNLTAEGYASTFNQPYDMGWYTETVRTGAFTKTLAEKPDVRFLINHDGLPLARTTAGSLDLSQDDSGLYTRARFNPADPDVQRLQVKAQDGLIDQMSFGFRTIQDKWNDDYSEREMVELSLRDGDVSAVTFPANPNTSFGIRSLDLDPLKVRAVYAELREERAGAEFSQQNRQKLMSLLESMDAINDGIEDQSEHLDGMFDTLNGMLGLDTPDPDDEQQNAAPAPQRRPSAYRAAIALLK